jgi:hypothetical protein
MNILPMRLFAAAIVVLLLTGGCAALTPSTPVEPKTEPPLARPAAPPPAPAEKAAPTGAPTPAAAKVAPAAAPAPAAAKAAIPVPQSASKAAAPVMTAPTPTAAPKASPVPVPPLPKPAAPSVAASPAPTAAAPLDLNALKEQLKETKAIGVFTKLTLKNQVDDLLQQFRDYYQSKTKLTLAELRRSYDLLLMKVLSLLQDADQKLASAIVSSREAIWALLADPKKFATLEG